ncbi:MAG: PDZ domain-containing protein, partial [Mariniblastus sp.]|nr:PDZ domain-containing protein [Mariniblastus sp.]
RKTGELYAKAAYKQVNRILNGSLAENESFVWELYNRLQAGKSESRDQTNNLGLQGDPIFRNDRIILRQNGAILNFTSGSTTNLVATLGENWLGSSSDLKRLSHIHQLNGLRFYHRNLSVDDAKAAANLKQLQFLAIQGCELVGFELHEIPFPETIQSLYLGQARLDETTINMLAKLKLQVLDLTEVEFSPEAENSLSTLQTVREMGWTRTPISSQMFEQMTQLPALNTLNLSVSKFGYIDKIQFSKKRPEVRFNNLPVAFLGVQGPQTISSYQRDADCLIDQVVADSSAAKAGIEPGDIIRKVDGQPIEKFEELRMFITQHDIGERLVLDVERDGKLIKIPVKLGSMDQAQVR